MSAEKVKVILPDYLADRESWSNEQAELVAKLESAYESKNQKDDVIPLSRFYGFRIGGVGVLIPNDVTCEVMEENKTYFIPLSQPFLIGNCNVRGNLVPVYDLEQFFLIQNEQVNTKMQKILILDKEDNAVGLLVNEMPSKQLFNQAEKVSKVTSTPEFLSNHVLFAYQKNNEVWYGINHVSMFEEILNKSN